MAQPVITIGAALSAGLFLAEFHPEIAEEFGGVVRDAAREADARVMRQRGLKKFCADDYMTDLTGLFAHYFPAPMAAKPVGWI